MTRMLFENEICELLSIEREIMYDRTETDTAITPIMKVPLLCRISFIIILKRFIQKILIGSLRWWPTKTIDMTQRSTGHEITT